ncbi:MAG: diphthine--ammonia ligase [Deltaproteobacteria bacterium]|nr:diphthine--ammonia ligase [Deltaproteobacteria bacterium]
MKAFCSWSGGKDSALAFFFAKRQGIDPIFLLNMIEETGKYTRSHRLPKEVILRQASEMEVKIIQVPTSWERYEENFKEAINQMKGSGIEAGVFGDIDLEEHRVWVERVCKELGVVPILPLWKMERPKVIEAFLNEGFKGFMCSTKFDQLADFLGKDIDIDFVQEMEKRSVDPCGENGEFHTFVYEGPIFKNPLRVMRKGIVKKDGIYSLTFEVEG